MFVYMYEYIRVHMYVYLFIQGALCSEKHEVAGAEEWDGLPTVET